jgi:hypothetical protein
MNRYRWKVWEHLGGEWEWEIQRDTPGFGWVDASSSLSFVVGSGVACEFVYGSEEEAVAAVATELARLRNQDDALDLRDAAEARRDSKPWVTTP